MTSLNGLVERFEERTRTLSTVRGEKAALEAAATASERKREAYMNEIAKLKEASKKMEKDLEDARTALLASPASVIAELETAKSEVRKLQAEKAAFEKKNQLAQNDTDWARKAYHDASNAAMDLKRQVVSLENENNLLQVKASSTAVELRTVNQNSENAVLRNQLSGLEATLKDREEMLRRKEEELRELRRGRGMGTRGTSVKPGGSPRGSRGVSPAGEPMHRVGSKGSSLRFGN